MADFMNAIATPNIAFKGLVLELAAGEPVKRSDGKLWVSTGGCASAFKFKTYSPNKCWAIKCFNKVPLNAAIHYQELSHYLSHTPISKYFVDATFYEQGIRTRDGKVHPILKMEWVNGTSLKSYIKKNLSSSHKLKTLADAWRRVCDDLTNARVGHGDLHHDNIMVIEDASGLLLKLIDLDSVFIAASQRHIDDTNKGFDGYQHPLREQLKKRCLEVDYFSHLVIYLSILALAEQGSLWSTLQLDNQEPILFSCKDFQQPQQSAIFKTLCNFNDEVAGLAIILKDICSIDDIAKIPSLEKNIQTNANSIAKKSSLVSPSPQLAKKSPTPWQKGTTSSTKTQNPNSTPIIQKPKSPQHGIWKIPKSPPSPIMIKAPTLNISQPSQQILPPVVPPVVKVLPVIPTNPQLPQVTIDNSNKLPSTTHPQQKTKGSHNLIIGIVIFIAFNLALIFGGKNVWYYLQNPNTANKCDLEQLKGIAVLCNK
ncbi:hypothetical protein HW132_27925 [Brasilonema sp. CT11]|nr:hypothetical protein [Brasilonema sp. CT11]